MSDASQITIDTATISDFSEMIQLYRQLWDNWPFYDEEKVKKIFETDLDTSRKIYLVAKRAGKIVGICSLSLKDDLHYLKKAFIEEVVVDESNRGQGIGKMLLNKAFEIAKENNCYRIDLYSNISRTDAHRFYEANGFEKGAYYFKKKLY